ncbi:MAG: diacylglycerol/lipid kinase family protein [Pseudobacter sp.]|uniref:diacylglycerol/lipid kinase family protein n=1 Tax=Pseudobacter sp. TaxID=2045420 RepID=UPI003F81E269
MKLAMLIHNPGAGDQEHSKKKLLDLLGSQGYDCRYFSTKKEGWDTLDPEVDLIIVAGGDGTVGKVARKMVEQKLNDKIPMALLPAGTANNIASTLGLSGELEDLVESWKPGLVKKFDLGLFRQEGSEELFLEGVGFGLFPKLIKVMKKIDDIPETAEESLELALSTLLEIVATAKSRYCKLELDGNDYSGEYLLLEILNTNSIGPNLKLAPQADPGDGRFDAVWIREDERTKLIEYLQHRLNKEEATPPFHSLSCRRVHLEWAGAQVHVDDMLEKKDEPPFPAVIELLPEMISFLVPAKPSAI